MILLLVACAEEPAGPEPLPAPRLLRRVSLELRGTLPSAWELDAVEQDPAMVEEYTARWLDDPALQERLVELLGERWHTRVDAFDIRHYDYALSDSAEFDFERAVGEEPLRLAARIVSADRSWTEVVTADFTMANGLLASLWPLEREETGEGWAPARWTDGRPAVGVLATNGLWWRYTTSTFNLSRSRVAAAARLFVCTDILDRPITFSATPSLLDPEGTAAAVRTEPTCLGCHSAVDPAASVLFGFVPAVPYNVDEVERYHPEREKMGAQELGVEPAWFGTPIASLAALGPAIAADPRFVPCAVRTWAEALWRREAGAEDQPELESLELLFREEELRVKPLLAAIVAGPTFGAGRSEIVATRRQLSAAQLASAVEDLTGFVWEEDGFLQLANDEHGYRVLAGGVNGVNVLRPQAEPGLTWALVSRRLAEGAAEAAVRRDLEGGGEPLLLKRVDLGTTPEDPAFAEQIDLLWWRLAAERASEADRAGWIGLWEAVEAQEGPAAAWIALLSVMLQDPEFLSE